MFVFSFFQAAIDHCTSRHFEYVARWIWGEVLYLPFSAYVTRDENQDGGFVIGYDKIEEAFCLSSSAFCPLL